MKTNTIILISILALAAAGGYYLYTRKKQPGSALPVTPTPATPANGIGGQIGDIWDSVAGLWK